MQCKRGIKRWVLPKSRKMMLPSNKVRRTVRGAGFEGLMMTPGV